MINLLDIHIIFGHFVATQGHSWPPKSKLSQTNHVTTQKDRKRGRIPMKIVLEVTFKRFRSFWVISMCIRILLLLRLFWLVTFLVYGNCEFGAQNGTVHSCTLVWFPIQRRYCSNITKKKSYVRKICLL